MKIIRLSTFLDFGGVETRLSNISHVQDANQWVFVCMDREGRASEIIKKNNKKVINLGAKPSIYSLKTLIKVYKVLKKEQPQVIHTSGAEANFHGILAAKLAGVPMIIGEEIGIPTHGKIARFIFSKVYALANFVVGNSQSVLDAVHVIDKVPHSRLVKVDNPILFKDLSPYEITPKDDNVFRIVMISRLEPVKNIEGVIRVVHSLVKNNGLAIRLTIAGSGQLEVSLKTLVADLQCEYIVDFKGFVSDPYPLLLNSDLYILNSFTEGFSNSLMEAMYSGVVALSTITGAAPEIIQDGDNGFLVDVNDEVALSEKINNIYTLSKQERVAIGTKGQQTVLDHFSLDHHISALMKIYK
jgi:glycosyltransferase involved in cell wall biosynthesis